MRIYNGFKEMYSEVGRDLIELGIIVPSHSVQNVYLEGGEIGAYDAKEITGYAYRLQNGADWKSVLDKEETNYVSQEICDRMDFYYQNPGRSYLKRLDVWEPYRNSEGEFDYTYNERIRTQLKQVLTELQKRPFTRQAVITIFNDRDYRGFGGKSRVPCSLTYQFLIRDDKIHCVYSMRSCDYFLHFKIDAALAWEMMRSISNDIRVKKHGQCQYGLGTLTHIIGSLHAFRKDWNAAGIF